MYKVKFINFYTIILYIIEHNSVTVQLNEVEPKEK